jgi:hypothetical protein
MLQGTVYTIPTASVVNIEAANTVTLQEAFQFGLATDTWTFTGQNFKMEVKASRDDPTALATWSTGGGTIVVDDAVNRVLHLNVSESALQAVLPVGEYVYDLVMYDGSAPPVRTMLMQGHLCVVQGVTES